MTGTRKHEGPLSRRLSVGLAVLAALVLASAAPVATDRFSTSADPDPEPEPPRAVSPFGSGGPAEAREQRPPRAATLNQESPGQDAADPNADAFLPIAHTSRPEPAARAAAPFAPYVPVPVDVVPNVEPYEPDLSDLVNRSAISRLTDAQRAALERNGFVVVPAPYEDFQYLYWLLDDNSQPAFVTTDALLHAFHVAFDGTLSVVEHEHLIAETSQLTDALLGRTEQQLAEARAMESGQVTEAALMNLAYLSVAARLLDPSAEVPADVDEMVERELELIRRKDGVSLSPIFGYEEDYSQYLPRGHYTHDPDLQRYFRAMMWYGRMAFHLDPPAGQEDGRRQTRGALLAVEALHTAQAGDRSALEVWDRIYDVTAFFVGKADDLTPYEYADLARQTYGRLPGPEDLDDQDVLDTFIVAAKQMRRPTIIGTPLKPGDEPMSSTHGFRLMGLRYVPDSEVFQRLVFNRVEGSHRGGGTPFTLFAGRRGFPRALDLPAAQGSARALEIMESEGDTAYEDYTDQLEGVQAQFAALDESTWTSNLYWGWLHGLRPLLDVPGEGYPYFMRQQAWVDKSLGTYLGSWTQLRRDSILYAKGCSGIPVSAPLPPEPTTGYVEPNPWAFARLAASTAQLRVGLKARDLLDGRSESALVRLEAVLLVLKTISERELRGEALSEAEQDFIRNIHEPLLSVQGLVDSAGYGSHDSQAAVVADVFSHFLARQVIEEGVGDVFEIYVIVPAEQADRYGRRQVVVTGGVFSHYEFKWPLDDRLTDDAWRELDPRPAQPAWTGSYIVPR